MTDIALRLELVSRHFGSVRAVDQLSMDIPSGAFVTLLGPSGCGKSTTLSLIAGLDRLDEGRILMGDEDITLTPPNERRMAMVFQMSGGQQQRVALGRALVKEPLVFLLDEPFSNLDAGLRSRMRTEVKHLHLKLRTTRSS